MRMGKRPFTCAIPFHSKPTPECHFHAYLVHFYQLDRRGAPDKNKGGKWVENLYF